MELSGAQIEQIHRAILSAFNAGSLRFMVRVYMDQKLYQIVDSGPFKDQVLTVIEWAEEQGRILDLIRGAASSVPKNPLLIQLAADARIWFPGAFERSATLEFSWVTVPSGSGTIGHTKWGSFSDDDERPACSIHLPKYRISKYSVTNYQYGEFISATGHRAPPHWVDGTYFHNKEEHPVVNVTYYDCLRFCAWAGVRLPTEAEWEKAAKGSTDRIWPWGDQRPTEDYCNFDDNIGDTTPVTAFPADATPDGVMNMAGNVWEWTSTLYLPYPYAITDGREEQNIDGRRSLRGGCWEDEFDEVRCTYRNWDFPDTLDRTNGFRVAISDSTE